MKSVLVNQLGYYIHVPVLRPEVYINNHPHKYYCECFILTDGSVIDARPSHSIMLSQLAMSQSSISSPEDFDRSWYIEQMMDLSGHPIMVRYDHQECTQFSNITDDQLTTLNMMSLEGIIEKNLTEMRSYPGYLRYLNSSNNISSSL